MQSSVSPEPLPTYAPWQQDCADRLVELYQDPARIPYNEIARRLSAEFTPARTARGCKAKIDQLGLKSRAPESESWPLERDERLKELYDSDEAPSYKVIAEQLNAEFGTSFTRNAVTGRVNRLGFANRQGFGYRPAPESKPRAPRISKPRQRYDAGSRRIRTIFSAVDAPEIRVIPLEPRSPDLSILDLGPLDCRYPFGGTNDVPAITFCGHPQHAGSSYCQHHKMLCQGVGTASERAATRVTVAA